LKTDRTTEYSLQFLKALEENLKIEWNQGGLPIFNSELINHISITKLASDLNDLVKSKLKDDAIVDIENPPKDNLIQTTGIGFAENFDLFTKLGFLLGDRVIMWDSMILGILTSSRVDLINKMELGKVACDLLMLKPAVELGGLAILPHPITWLERSRKYFSVINGQNDISTEFIGYVNARALLDEKFPLHPYSIRQNKSLFKSIIGSNSLMKEEKIEYHKLLSNLLVNENFVFLKDITAANFYRVMNILNSTTEDQSHYNLQDFREDLASHLTLPDIGLSEQEKNVFINNIFKKLNRNILVQNSELEKHTRATKGSVLGAVGASISFIYSLFSGDVIIKILAEGLNVSANKINLLEQIAGKPKEMSFYQVFNTLDEVAEKEKINEISRNISNAQIFGNNPFETSLES
jgi:hypothetical protein